MHNGIYHLWLMTSRCFSKSFFGYYNDLRCSLIKYKVYDQLSNHISQGHCCVLNMLMPKNDLNN